jgi:hypothetical protein
MQLARGDFVHQFSWRRGVAGLAALTARLGASRAFLFGLFGWFLGCMGRPQPCPDPNKS